MLITLALSAFSLVTVLGSANSRADEVDIAVEAFAAGGRAVGVSIGSAEKELAKSLVRCVVHGKSVPDCARDEVINRLPEEARPYAQCLVVEGKSVQQCAVSGVIAKLPPQARQIAECIATSGDVAQCGKNFAMDQLDQAQQAALKQVFDTLDKLKIDEVARNPLTDTPSSVQSIIKVAEGIREKNWGQVTLYGGREVAKAVAKTVVRSVVPAPIAVVLDPAVDALVEERFDLIEGIIAAAWGGDAERLGELYVESYILTGTPFGQGLMAACSIIPEGAVKELTCGTAGKILSWVTGAGGDAVGGIGDVAGDVALALGGNKCKAAPLFYKDTIAGCLPWGVSSLAEASLKPDDEARASLFPDLEKQIYAQCRRDVQSWYKRGVFGTTSTSECANSVCDPLRAQFQDQTYVVTQALLDTAYTFGRAARYEAQAVKIGGGGSTAIYRCQRWGAEAKFVSDCTNALERQFAYLDNEALRCTVLGTPTKSTAPFWRICQAEVERAGKSSIRNCGCPEGMYRTGAYGADGFVCSIAVPKAPIPPGLDIVKKPPFSGVAKPPVDVDAVAEAQPGTMVDMSIPEPIKARPMPRPNSPPASTPTVELCPSPAYGTAPNCKCPPRWAWTGARCIPSPASQPESFCPADRPVGTYPNCCPLGYEYAGGSCRQPQWPPVVDAGGTTDEGTPYALKIGKTGSQSCQPGGECRFDITISNDGPNPHNDPVTIIDGIAGDGLQSAEIVSITPALPCPQQPTRIPFQCTVPTMKLDVGDKFTHTIVVRIPEGAKSFRNCAVISSPESAAARTDAPQPPGKPVAEATDCHDVAVEPERTTDTSPPPLASDPPPPVSRPPSGMKVCSGDRPVGTYPNCCPRGFEYTGGACRRLMPQSPPVDAGGLQNKYTKTCPDGSKVPRWKKCPAQPQPPPQPQQPQRPPVDAGGLQNKYIKTCPDGSRIPRWKRCPTQQPQPQPQPQPQNPQRPARCPPGQIGRPPYCRPIKKPAPTPAPATCPPGTYGTPPKCTGILR